MSCSIRTAYAPNGKESGLFNTLKMNYGDSTAEQIWLYLRSQEFKKKFGDWMSPSFSNKEKLDSNGEPRLDLLNFPDDFKFDYKADPETRSLRAKIKKYEDMLESMEDVLTRKKSLYFNTGKKNYEKKIKDLQESMSKLDTKRAIFAFVNKAIQEINQMSKRFEEAEEGKDISIHDLRRYNDYLSAYDLLDSLKVELGKDKEISKGELKILNNAVGAKNDMKQKYLQRVKTVVAKDLSSLDKNFTQEEIENLLTNSPYDVSFARALAEYMGDSDDPILGLIAKRVNEQKQKTREAHIQFSTELENQLKKLEEAYPEYKGKPEKLYRQILEIDDSGKLTGRLVSRFKVEEFNRALDKARQEAKESLDNKGESNYGKYMSLWFKANVENVPNASEIIKQRRESLSKEAFEVWAEKNIGKSKKGKTYYKAGGELTQPKESIWSNPEFDYLSSPENKAIKEFYDFYVGAYEKFQSYLPETHRKGSKLPSIRKSLLERVGDQGQSALKRSKDQLKESFVKQQGDIQYGQIDNESGEVVDFVPVFFTYEYDAVTYQKVKKKELKRLMDKGLTDQDAEIEAHRIAAIAAKEDLLKDLSYDLTSSLQSFAYMAEDYKNLTEVLDILEGAKDLVRERTVTQTTSDGRKRFSSIVGLKDAEIKKKGVETNSYKQVQHFMKMLVYGQEREELYLSAFGKQVDVSKVLGTLGSYNALRTLGLNYIQGMANVTQGEIMNWAEAVAGEFFTSSDYRAAHKEYSKELAQVVGDVGARRPKSKLGLMLERYDVLGDYSDGNEEVSTKDNTRIKKLIATNSLFFIQNMGEHFIQSKIMIAMLKNKKALDKKGKPIVRDGKEMSVYDMHIAKNGKLEMSPEVGNFSLKEQREFSRQVQAVLRRMHGNYNRETSARFQSNALLMLAFQFRKWLPTGVARRFGGTQYHVFLGQEVEGNYISAARFLKQISKDLVTLKFALVKTDWNKLSTHEKANIMRTITEASALVISIGVYLTFLRIAEELDDDEDYVTKTGALTTAYLARRLQTELMFFVWPPEFIKLLATPAAAMSTVQAAGELVNQLMPHNITERFERGQNKGELKLKKRVNEMIPLLRTNNDLSPEGMRGKLQWYR